METLNVRCQLKISVESGVISGVSCTGAGAGAPFCTGVNESTTAYLVYDVADDTKQAQRQPRHIHQAQLVSTHFYC